MNAFYYVFRLYPKLRSLFHCYWNRIWFRIIGITYGKNMRVFDKIYIHGNGNITIGDNFVFTSGAGINPICRNILGALSVPFKNSQIIIGNNVGISSACLWAKERIVIGNNVNIGGSCMILDNDAHPHDYIKRRNDYCEYVGLEKYSHEIPTLPIVIEDDVWIGAHSLILKGVRIGARSIIAAGSVVTSDIPSDSIAGGNPAKVIRKLC